MAYKTNYIDINKPAKVLSVNVTSINGEAQWSENDGAGDKWYSGGTNPKYYQWFPKVWSPVVKNFLWPQ